MTKLTKSALIASVILGIIWSCQTDDDPKVSLEKPSDPAVTTDRASMIKLGRKLDNPHSVSNMRLAFSNLNSSSRKASDFKIDATNLYVRFLPASYEELEVLTDDTTLLIFDHPLDYEFVEEGGYYHDPTIPDTLPTWQYSVVPVDYSFPHIQYEILDSAFVPNNYEPAGDGRSSIDSEFLEALELEAFILTGNMKEEERIAKNCPDFKPQGTIKVSGIPIQGVTVAATNFLDNKSTQTDAFGNYFINEKFSRSVKMHVKWQRNHFHIKDGALSEAQYIDKEECGNWSVDFPSGSEPAFHAHLFRAAYRYYYLDINGLRRPPMNDWDSERMQIRAFYENNSDGNGFHKEERRIFGNWIHIYNPFNSHESIFSTTIHELAHSSHWHMKKGDFDDSESKVKESWARGVQWVLTGLDYPGHRGGGTFRPNYTQVVVDLIDPNYASSSSSDNLNFGLWDDNVTGYSIRQIEDALAGQKRWNEWRDRIKNLYTNATENNIDALFTFWN